VKLTPNKLGLLLVVFVENKTLLAGRSAIDQRNPLWLPESLSPQLGRDEARMIVGIRGSEVCTHNSMTSTCA